MRFKNQYFSLNTKFTQDSIQIKMQVLNGQHNTDFFAGVVEFLTHHAPDVLRTTCHNPGHLPFKREVKKTEMGHLFEHILITYMCDEAIKAGAEDVHYSAETSWDWRENPRGSFDIVVNATMPKNIFTLAFQRAVELISLLFTNQTTAVVPAAV